MIRALHITPIDKIILVIPVSTGNHRLSDKAADPDAFPSLPASAVDQVCSNITSVDAVNNIPKIAVAGRVQSGLSRLLMNLNEMLGMRQRQMRSSRSLT